MHSVIILLVSQAGSVLTFTIVLLHLVLCCSDTTAPKRVHSEVLLHEASSHHVYIPCCSDGWMVAASVHLKVASHQHGWCKGARLSSKKCTCQDGKEMWLHPILAAARAEATVTSDPLGTWQSIPQHSVPVLRCLLPSWPPPSLLPSWLARSSSCSSSMAPRANPAQP